MIRDEYHSLQHSKSKQIMGYGEGEELLDNVTRRRVHHIEHYFDYLSPEYPIQQ